MKHIIEDNMPNLLIIYNFNNFNNCLAVCIFTNYMFKFGFMFYL
jgi:hypothetical protein